ncbi:MAG: TlpA family protein disulfide reductase [Oscillospiraceae bacterium]|nr:TlpA family protein disulfide reductase [Oscillospiraceae bacterium]
MLIKRIVSFLTVLIAVLILCSCGKNGDSSKYEGPEGFVSDRDYSYRGDGFGGFPSLESFTAGTDDGGTFTSGDLASRDMTLINIWATWCGPCLNEMPELAEFAELLPDSIGFYTLCVDGYEDTDNMASILSKAGYSGKTIISGTGDIGNLVDSAMYVPTTVFVDSSGQIAGSVVGSPRENLAGCYLAALNDALENTGLQRISLPGVTEAESNG